MDPKLTEAEKEALNKIVDDLEKLKQQFKRLAESMAESSRIQAAYKAPSMEERLERIIERLAKMTPTPKSEPEHHTICFDSVIESDSNVQKAGDDILITSVSEVGLAQVDVIDNFDSAFATGVFDLCLEVSPIDSTHEEVISVHSSSMLALSKKEIQNDKYGLEFRKTVYLQSWCSPQPLKRTPIDFKSVVVLKVDDTGHKSEEFESGTIISRRLNFCTEPVRQNVCEVFAFLLPPAKPPDECLSLLQDYNIWCCTKCWDLALSSIQQKELLVWTATRDLIVVNSSAKPLVLQILVSVVKSFEGIMDLGTTEAIIRPVKEFDEEFANQVIHADLWELEEEYRAWMINEKDDFVRIGYLKGVELDELTGKVTISISFVPALGGYAFKDGCLPSPLDLSLMKDMSSLLHSEMLGELNEGYDILYGSEEFLVIWLHKPPRLPPENVLKIDMLDDDVSLLTIEESILEAKDSDDVVHIGGEDYDSKMIIHFYPELGKYNIIENLKVQQHITDFNRAGMYISSTTQTTFEVDMVTDIPGVVIVVYTWPKNYGDPSKRKDLSTLLRGAATSISSDEKVVLREVAQSLFEGSIYTFELLQTILSPIDKESTCLAKYMLAYMMGGPSASRLTTHSSTKVKCLIHIIIMLFGDHGHGKPTEVVEVPDIYHYSSFWVLLNFGSFVKDGVDLCEGSGYLEWIRSVDWGLQVWLNNENDKGRYVSYFQATHDIKLPPKIRRLASIHIWHFIDHFSPLIIKLRSEKMVSLNAMYVASSLTTSGSKVMYSKKLSSVDGGLVVQGMQDGVSTFADN
ncbi:unnamed protein product [Rhodiola kirilowii]